MKSVLLFLVFLSVSFPQQWQWQNPEPQGDYYESLVITGNVIWTATGVNILRSSNLGKTWTQVYEIPSEISMIRGISFINQSTGWAVVSSGFDVVLIKTTDGGAGWSKVADLPGEVHELKFIDELTGFLFFDHVSKTTDGGLTWTITTDSASSRIYPSFVNDSTFWIMSFSEGFTWEGSNFTYTLYSTTDRGSSWIKLYDAESFYYDFVDADTGYVFENGRLHLSTDGGNSWNYVADLPAQGWGIFVTGTIGIMFSEQDVYRTSNGGISWIHVFNSGYDLDKIFSSGDLLFITGITGYIAYSTNGGSSWNSDYHNSAPSPFSDFAAVHFSDLQHGWVVGSYNSVLKTSDSGATWHQVHITNSEENFAAVLFLNDNIGYIGGNDLYKTTDGGATWNALVTNIYVRDIQLLNSKTLYALGINFISKTTDGGISWTAKPHSGVSSWMKIFFTSADTGFLTGRMHIYMTTDGGDSWVNKYTDADDIIFTDVFFVDQMHGWAVGNGVTYRTTDGGNSWTSGSSQLSYLPGIYFKDVNNGVAFSFGNIYHTTNSGDSWELEQAITFSNFAALSGFGETLWAVGQRGVIVKNSGSIIPVELSSFTAQLKENSVELNWVTQTETNNRGFEIQKRSDDNDYKTISFIRGQGTTTEPSVYSYTDSGLLPGTLTYRLRQVDYDGSFSFSEEIEVIAGAMPSVFSLEQNYPNPFNPSTKIIYTVPVTAYIRIAVYDALGKEVKVLADKEVSAGRYETDFNILGLSGGVYFCRMEAGGYSNTIKLVLLK